MIVTINASCFSLVSFILISALSDRASGFPISIRSVSRSFVLGSLRCPIASDPPLHRKQKIQDKINAA